MINLNKIADAVCRVLQIPSDKVRVATLARSLVDAHGAVSNPGAPAFSAITGTPTTLAGYGITDAQPLNAKLTTYVGTKIYRALLTQSSTGAPTAVVLENTLGGTPVLTRTTEGIYVATLAGAFPVAKTFIPALQFSNGASGIYTNTIAATDTVTITVLDPVNGPIELDGSLSFEIIVYP